MKFLKLWWFNFKIKHRINSLATNELWIERYLIRKGVSRQQRRWFRRKGWTYKIAA